MKIITSIYFLWPILRDLVSYIFVAEEVESPESVKEEISEVFIHVDSQDPAIKAIYGSPTIHHL